MAEGGKKKYPEAESHDGIGQVDTGAWRIIGYLYCTGKVEKMSQQTLADLSRFVGFVAVTLLSTERVKNILESQCDEARYVLKPWLSETKAPVTKEINRDLCTCERVSSNEEQINEIASGIHGAVVQAQRLRKELQAMNVSKENNNNNRNSNSNSNSSGSSKARELTLHKIFASTSSMVKNLEYKTSGLKRNKPDIREENCPKSVHVDTARHGLKKSTGASKESTPTKTAKSVVRTATDSRSMKISLKLKHNGTKAKVTLESASKVYESVTRLSKLTGSGLPIGKKLLRPSPYDTPAKKSKAVCKRKPSDGNSVENTAEYAKSATSSGTCGKRSLTLTACTAASTSELDNLVSNVSPVSDRTLYGSHTSLEMNNCPVHDENVSAFVQDEKRFITNVDMLEGLDECGVPSELVKVLKVYHRYLKQEVPMTNRLTKDRSKEKGVYDFISVFNTMNKERRMFLKEEPLAGLTTDFIILFNDSHGRRVEDLVEARKLKSRYRDLEYTCKSYRIRGGDFGPTKERMSDIIGENDYLDYYQKIRRGWRLLGIWNDTSIATDYFQAMSRTRCIRYVDSIQLLSLVEIMQRAQRLQYQKNLIGLLIEHVIPVLPCTFDPTGKEYAESYKMLSIISSDVLNPNAPLLVRTDK